MAQNPWNSAKKISPAVPAWISDPDDAARVAAYEAFEGIYKNDDTLAVIMRGKEHQPLYLPTARTLIDTTNRFLAKRWTYSTQPNVGTPEEQQVLTNFLDNLFRRERIWQKFNRQKRMGLIRGDQVWMITADSEKEAGKRISIHAVHPGNFFPIKDASNPEKLSGVHLAELFTLPDGKQCVRRQTYRKNEDGQIEYSQQWFKPGAWDDRDPALKLEAAEAIPQDAETIPPTLLDPRITAIPVYHIRNGETEHLFGSSDLSGFESLLASMNQRVTDQDVTLTLEGLGLYVTTSGPPVDENGREQKWAFGPGYVLEIDEDSDFKRISGVSNIDASLSHLDRVERSLKEALGTSDAAIGRVNVNIAESGIALELEMNPLISRCEEKELEILSVIDQMLYDLVTMWMPVYEEIEVAARVVSLTESPLPINRKNVVAEITQLLSTDPPLISAEYARTILSEKLGYEFPENMANAVVTEAEALAKARNADPFTSRVEQELEDGGEAS